MAVLKTRAQSALPTKTPSSPPGITYADVAAERASPSCTGEAGVPPMTQGPRPTRAAAAAGRTTIQDSLKPQHLIRERAPKSSSTATNQKSKKTQKKTSSSIKTRNKANRANSKAGTTAVIHNKRQSGTTSKGKRLATSPMAERPQKRPVIVFEGEGSPAHRQKTPTKRILRQNPTKDIVINVSDDEDSIRGPST